MRCKKPGTNEIKPTCLHIIMPCEVLLLKKFKTAALDFLCYLAGSLLYSFGLLSFASPNHIAPGGVSGIATMLNYLFNIPIGLSVLVINIPLLLIGYKAMGRRFIGKTAIATITMSITLDIAAPLIWKYEGEPMLAAIFGGLICGTGLAIFFVRGATSGGTDIVVRLLQRKFPFLSTGRFVLIVDAVVVAASMFVYKNIENALYALIFIFISSKLIDIILFGQVNGKVVTIITTHEKEISQEITRKFARGLTILNVKGGYTEKEKVMIYCAVQNTQVTRLVKAVRVIDPQSFMVVSEAREIVGEFER